MNRATYSAGAATAARHGRHRPDTEPANTVPILMYHVLGTRATPGFTRFTLRPDLFVAHLELLTELGYQTVTVSQLAALRAAGRTRGRRIVALTFDDGYADFHTHALPALARFNATATLYVTTGHLGGVADWTHGDHEADRRMLSWEQLADVAAAGVEIGAHSRTHPELDLLGPDVLRAELNHPRAELADRLGIPVDSFAYPFGYYSPAVRAAVAEAGYRSACVVRDMASDAASDPLTLPRLSVNADTDVPRLRRLLASLPTVRSRCRAEAKRLAWQACRRYRPRHRFAAVAATPGRADGPQ